MAVQNDVILERQIVTVCNDVKLKRRRLMSVINSIQPDNYNDTLKSDVKLKLQMARSNITLNYHNEKWQCEMT